MSSLKQIRAAIGIVIVGLVLSGVTAFLLLHEMNLLAAMLAGESRNPAAHDGIEATYQKYAFLAYGTDWLAFAH